MGRACRGIDNDRFVFLKDELQGIAGDDVSILDVSDPERPINFIPKDRKRSLPEEDMEAEDRTEKKSSYQISLRGVLGPGTILNWAMILIVGLEVPKRTQNMLLLKLIQLVLVIWSLMRTGMLVWKKKRLKRR